MRCASDRKLRSRRRHESEVRVLPGPIAQLQVVLEFDEEFVVGGGGMGAAETGAGVNVDFEALVVVEHKAVESQTYAFGVFDVGHNNQAAALACMESGRRTFDALRSSHVTDLFPLLRAVSV